MKHKRGADHGWEIRKYTWNMACYARCKCGYQYACGGGLHDEDKEFENWKIYQFCPRCGARKKWFDSEAIKIEGEYPWGEKRVDSEKSSTS